MGGHQAMLVVGGHQAMLVVGGLQAMLVVGYHQAMLVVGGHQAMIADLLAVGGHLTTDHQSGSLPVLTCVLLQYQSTVSQIVTTVVLPVKVQQLQKSKQ